MPGITPRDMNGYDYDRGPRGPVMANGYDPYRDEYQREDPYRRDDEDIYRGQGRLGRFGGDYMDQSSVADMRNSGEPTFELDHLATFAAATREGYIQPEDGLRKLRQMENTTGIWTMRCQLTIERRYLVILDNQTGEQLEKFPIQSVHSPTAIFNKDRREIYNNLVLFTVGEDPKKRTQADMHIFQSVDTAAQNIVDEILVAQKGGQRGSYQSHKIQQPPIHPQPSSRDMYEFNGMKEFLNTQQQSSRLFGGGPSRAMMVNRSYREEFEPGQNEVLERDVQLLNHCFDDIEKFVSRLQQAAESYKELEKRKKERNSKDKRRMAGEGIMGFRARPPPSSDFTDIFQKFKLSFNLLAKLKAHIHDPNAPELVHFLFTPLSLIYEASRDPVHGNQNLAEGAIAPILTSDAKQLLVNCLTSKEIELWRALGSTWTTSRDEWKGYVPNYTPRFYDGWQPAPGPMENGFRNHPDLESAALAQAAQARSRYEEEQARSFVSERVVPFPPEEDRGVRYGRLGDYQRRDFDRPSPRAPTPPRQAMGNPAVAGYREYVEQHIERNIRAQENHIRPEPSYQDENSAYIAELKASGHQVCEVIHDREGRNSKELSLRKGDIVGVIDNSRNWWKVRNIEGKVGFAPYTIMKELKDDDEAPLERPSSGNYNSYILNENDQPPVSDLRRSVDQDDLNLDLNYLESSMSDSGRENRDKYYRDSDRDDRDKYYRDDSGRDDRDKYYRDDSGRKNQDKYYRDESPRDRDNYREESLELKYRPKKVNAHSDLHSSKKPDKSYVYSKVKPKDKFSSIDREAERPSYQGHRRGDSYSRETTLHQAQYAERQTVEDEVSDSNYFNAQLRREKENWQDDRPGRSRPRPTDYVNYNEEDSASPSPQLSPRPVRSPRNVSDNLPPPPPKAKVHNPEPERAFKPVNPDRQRATDEITHQLRHVSPSPPKPNSTRPLPNIPVRTKDDDLRDELKSQVGNRGDKVRQTNYVNYINPDSSANQVMEWLHTKGFSSNAIETFTGYTGEDMFNLRNDEINRLVHREDAHHLESLLRVQRNMSGFGAAKGGAELQAILQKRKQKADVGRKSSGFGEAPSFRPQTPTHSVDGRSETTEDLDFENTGKTLRDLLIRQRLKIMKSTYNQPDDE
ncbi:uncharacterized protein LOC126823921 isoform X2 [Patella vulgata]|uniref:uncharacterized protein LOC126823921 isoform X2 n=1 Tax=Patella vulgata TaxID=6465 RepID=UPI0021801A06|nr:uncharacterized protein LOC126823921 isoform X2 [Patella vulgata]